MLATRPTLPFLALLLPCHSTNLETETDAFACGAAAQTELLGKKDLLSFPAGEPHSFGAGPSGLGAADLQHRRQRHQSLVAWQQKCTERQCRVHAPPCNSMPPRLDSIAGRRRSNAHPHSYGLYRSWPTFSLRVVAVSMDCRRVLRCCLDLQGGRLAWAHMLSLLQPFLLRLHASRASEDRELQPVPRVARVVPATGRAKFERAAPPPGSPPPPAAAVTATTGPVGSSNQGCARVAGGRRRKLREPVFPSSLTKKSRLSLRCLRARKVLSEPKR